MLLALRLLEESWPAELARALDANLYSVQRILAAYESEGIVVSRAMGRTRRVALNPRYFAFKELNALLWKLGLRDSALQAKLGARRRRPRAPGKPGLR